MFDTLIFESLGAPFASVLFGAGLGLLFGAIALHIRFCFRRGLVGDMADRRAARGVWFTALAVAILGTQGTVVLGWIDFADHRFMSADLPIVAIAVGGLLFGAGMVLTRGCVSRLTVLTGSGNLRAFFVLVIFAITAHAALKGVLAPIRTSLGGMTIPLGDITSFASLPGGASVWSLVLAAVALGFAWNSNAKSSHLMWAGILGLLAPLGWIGTGFVLLDEFEPIALQSLSFTSPSADLLFYGVASTAIPAGFGVGLMLGVVGGAAIAAVLKGEFQWQSFENPAQTGRYSAGAVMMGLGGVLAGGCTVGAGLSGIPTLSFAAVLAIAFMAIGGLATQAVLQRGPTGAVIPAE